MFFRLYRNSHDSHQWIIHKFIHTYLTLLHLIISLWVCILSKMIIQFSHKILEFAARTGNRVSPEIPCVDYLCYKRSNFHDAHNLWLGTSVGRGSQLLSLRNGLQPNQTLNFVKHAVFKISLPEIYLQWTLLTIAIFCWFWISQTSLIFQPCIPYHKTHNGLKTFKPLKEWTIVFTHCRIFQSFKYHFSHGCSTRHSYHRHHDIWIGSSIKLPHRGKWNKMFSFFKI